MDELLLGLQLLDETVGEDVARFSGRLRGDRHAQLDILRDVWPHELEELCNHTELLKLLVWVCEGSSCQPQRGREL